MKKILSIFASILVAGCVFGASTDTAKFYNADQVMNAVFEYANGDSSIAMMDFVHRKVENGKFWRATQIGDLTNGTSSYFYFVVPSTGSIDMMFEVSSEGNAYFYLWEDAVAGSSGTQQVPVNVNRESTEVNYFAVHPAALNVSTGTTRICANFIAGGSGPFKSGGTERSSFEWRLYPGKNYCAAVWNISGSNSETQLTMLWYTE